MGYGPGSVSNFCDTPADWSVVGGSPLKHSQHMLTLQPLGVI